MAYRHGGDTLDFVYARKSEPIDRGAQAHGNSDGWWEDLIKIGSEMGGVLKSE